jgi:nicotinamidase-related amidase
VADIEESQMTTARPWDKFLTKRDKEHLSIIGDRPPVGWGRSPAVLLIDNYRGVLGTASEPLLDQVRHLPMGTGEEGWTAIGHVVSVVAAARAAGVPVVHHTGLATDGLASFFDAYRGGGVDVETAAASFEFPPELTPAPGEVVLAKSAPSAFFGTILVGHLQHLGVDTLIVCGETTSGCVRATVVDACSYRYRVIVPEECSYDRHEACHAINLFDMDQKYADVVPVSEVLEHLATSDAPPARVPEPAGRT